MEENALGFENLHKVLQEVAKQAKEVYRYQLSLGGKRASGALREKILEEVKVNGQTYEVVLNLLEYWKYVEGGAKGKDSSPVGAAGKVHFPPISAIERWISVKPIIPKIGKGKTIPSVKSLAFLIARKIYRRGIEPHPALEQTQKEIIDEWQDKIREAFKKDIEGRVSLGLNIGKGQLFDKKLKL